MILFQVDLGSVSVGEFECNAPRTVDMDRVPGGSEAEERVKVETGNIQLRNCLGIVQGIEPTFDARVKPAVNFAAVAFFKQFGEFQTVRRGLYA